MTTSTADTKLTRAEAAYAHLASFQRGDRVNVGGRLICFPAIVMTAQQHDYSDINRAYLVVSNEGTEIKVTVGQLLAGHRTIASRADAAAGRVPYFDAATWAMQNPGA